METAASALPETNKGRLTFKLTLPKLEAKLMQECYERASCVLEYGSGGSTLLAMRLKVPHVFSVESDLSWTRNLEERVSQDFPSQHCVIHHVDIGPTKEWGRPADNSGFARYHRYPADVWDRQDFVDPDVVLIDGRFRTACFLATILRARKPLTILFDDYVDREYYHWIENIVAPVAHAGRMARFEISPGSCPVDHMTQIVGAFVDAR